MPVFNQTTQRSIKMFQIKLCLFSILTIQCFAQEFSDLDANVQFLCGKSKSISKCDCRQETNDILNIPLFIIDCSRLDFKVSPDQKVLPLLMSHLDLSHNKIEHLNEHTEINSTTLQYLDYSYNKISNISSRYFDGLTTLIGLNLEYNILSNLDNVLIKLKQLKVLNLASNNISYIPNNFFDNLQQLHELDLSQNNLGQFFLDLHIQVLPFSLMTLRLNAINLKNITSATFAGLTNVKICTIIDNPIQDMIILPFKDIEYLDISGINISKIEEKHLNFSFLQELKMNRLSRLTTIGDLAFANLQKLEVLTIENCNDLSELGSLVFGFLNQNTAKEYDLKKLSLARNNISYLYGGFEYLFRNLEEVHLNENPWHCGCELTWMTHLKNVENVNDTR